MSLNHFLLMVLTLSIIANCEYEENRSGGATGVFDSVLNETLESLRPGLMNVYVQNQSFQTGVQEFGNFSGNFSEVTVTGLEEFIVTVINTSRLDLNNLTMQYNFTAKGSYHFSGILTFPLGKKDILLFGGGKFSAKFTNLSISVKMKLRFRNSTNIIQDFDIVVGLDKIQVYFKNLMGGGDLEQVFNQLVNDVGLTVFNYYTGPILNIVKPQIVHILTNMLNKKIKNTITKDELQRT